MSSDKTKTAIWISPELKEQLAKRGKFGETYEQVIERLLKGER